jgi:hypothetical protein
MIIVGEQYRPEHSLKSLFEAFRKIVLKKIRAEDRDNFNKLLDRFYVLVYNYYYLKCFEPKLKKLEMQLIDDENTFLKYPENNLSIQIDYWSLANNLDKEDIGLIDRDLIKAEKTLLKFNSLFTQAKFI